MKLLFKPLLHLVEARILTTEAVLTEYLNALAEKGPRVREAAIRTVEAILTDSQVTVLFQGRTAFKRGFMFYKARPDKGYSLTDCMSMTVMHEHRMLHALTTDRHFEQEGFVALMRPQASR